MFDDGAEGETVLRPREAVAFVGEHDVDDRNVLLRHRRDDLIALGHFAAHVVGAVSDQHRLLDVAGTMQRRARPQERDAVRRARIADAMEFRS